MEAQKAADELEESFPAQAGGSATLVFSVENGSLRSQANTDAIDASLAEVARLDHVVSVSDPLAEGAIASSDRIGFAEVRYDREVIDLGRDDFEALKGSVSTLGVGGVQAEVGGPLAAWERATETSSEQIGLLIAVVVLLFAFGSVIAMLLPIGMALFALAVGETIIAILAASTNVPTSATALAAMIGLGVGIDYTLFIVTRFREARDAGSGVVDAVAEASATAGSAVLFAGTSVVIAISGLLISGLWAVGLLGLAAAIVEPPGTTPAPIPAAS